MDIKIGSSALIKSRQGAIVVGFYEGSEQPEGQAAAVDAELGGIIAQLIQQGDLKGKAKEINLIYSMGKLPAAKVIVLGMGKKNELTLEKVRVATADLVKYLSQKNVETASLELFSGSGLEAQQVAQAMTEGALLGSYTFRRYITKAAENKPVKILEIITSERGAIGLLKEGCRKGQIMAEAANFARDMANEPSNVVTPSELARTAVEVARKHKLSVKIIERKEMQKLKMGGLLGVAQGSREIPKFIILDYRGRESDEVDIALVGKGITFDSGGISIKPSEGMADMKGDKAGAAAVLAAISAIAQYKPGLNVQALIPATENLPSGTSFKPGDVITIMNGKTVEIVTTDAEGRLILADAISYALKQGAKKIVDVATLTGACQVALGDVCTGAFGNNQEFMDLILRAGKQSGECVWQMPMNEEYQELNKSDIADLKNSGGRYGGAISAAWFLGEFVGKTPWIHLDIAGTSDIAKERGYLVKGATGVPVRTLVNLVMALADK
jgi:leucyl aminopeptidase